MSITNQQTIENVDLEPIRDLVSETSGIYFEEKKFYFFEKRVARRIKATNSKNAKEYFKLLHLSDASEEMKELISALTTNETYFYRNIPQLESFAEEALGIVVDEKRKKGDYTLRIWSAACSSGDEPYTLAMMLKEQLSDFSRWKIEILATDIDHNILDKAKRAVYDQRAVKDLPPTYLKQYFTEEDNRFSVVSQIKEMVTFKILNLMDRRAMRSMTGMDFVFCRNVLIYFDDNARKQVVNSIYDSLNQGGFIFLGHSESVGKISAVFKLAKLKKSLSYRK